jgi:hypothetical protein
MREDYYRDKLEDESIGLYKDNTSPSFNYIIL